MLQDHCFDTIKQLFLRRLLTKAVDGPYLNRFTVGSRTNNLFMVSHLLLVDNSLTFYGNNSEQLGYLKCVLLSFKAVSGLKINFF